MKIMSSDDDEDDDGKWSYQQRRRSSLGSMIETKLLPSNHAFFVGDDE